MPGFGGGFSSRFRGALRAPTKLTRGGGGIGGVGAAPQMQAPQMASPSTAQYQALPAQSYTPYGGGAPGGGATQVGAGMAGGPTGSLQGNLGLGSQAGAGLLDPNSEYYKRLSQAMGQQIGGQAAAGQRASALRGAYSGLGAGASPEQMMTSADIGQAGLEARGMAESGLALQAPGMGLQALQQTYAPYLGIEQLGEMSRQFGSGQAEQARQFGVGAGLQQQQMAQQNAAQQAQLQQQTAMANLNAQIQQQQMMAQMAGMFGGF